MTWSMRSIVILLVIFINSPLFAATDYPRLVNPDDILASQSSALAKTAADTVLLIGPHGSGAWYNDQFERENGVPDWQGWTSEDLTKNESH